MAPPKGRQQTKLDPAPRDTAPSGTVKYPQNKEGGLNKYAKTEKDKRSAKAIDNFDITLKSKFKHEFKDTTEVMGLNIEATKLIWILFNEDNEQGVAVTLQISRTKRKHDSPSLQRRPQKKRGDYR